MAQDMFNWAIVSSDGQIVYDVMEFNEYISNEDVPVVERVR